MPQNGLNGLTADQVHRIRTARLPDEYFAKLYGQCRDSIANARRGRTYKDHSTPPDNVGRSGRGRHSKFDYAFGSPVAIGIEPCNRLLYDRLRAWVEVDADECWLWTGAYHSSTPYPSGHHGQISIVPGKTTSTHRAMWLAVHGEIPDGKHVLHRCDKPRCINPAHLWVGTHAENMRDMYKKGRHSLKAKTECRRGHPLPEPNAMGLRPCKECIRLHSREFQRRKRAKEALGIQ